MNEQPANAGAKQETRRGNGTFAPGVSGNPSGRRQGRRSHVALALDQLAAKDAHEVLRTALDMAKAGDVQAIRLILDRAWPAPKGRPISGVTLPPIRSVTDVVTAMTVIAEAVSAGQVSSEEAKDLSTMLEGFRKVFDLVEIEQRLKALERAQARRGTEVVEHVVKRRDYSLEDGSHEPDVQAEAAI